MNQIIINFKNNKNDYLEDDFIKSESNYNAHQLIKHWPDFWGSQFLIINGPEGSGKSHLANIWKKKSNAFSVTAENITETLFELEDEVLNFLIEDVDKLTNEYSEEIFHLYNKVKFSGGYMLLTSRNPIFKFKTNLSDLKSRLNSALVSVIKEPDEDLLKAIHFIEMMIERDYPSPAKEEKIKTNTWGITRRDK